MYKYQIAGIREQVWSENMIRFQTPEEAKEGAKELLGRWMGADLARVVPAETPNREAVDMDDPQILVNYRKKS